MNDALPLRSAPSVALPPTRRAAALALLIGSLAALSAGCEESGARAHAEADREIAAVTDELRLKRTMTPAIEDADAVAALRASLGSLSSRLTSIQGAAPGQQAAANLLAASIQVDMGRQAMDRVQEFQRQLRDEGRQLSGLISAAAALDSLATAVGSFDPSKDRGELERLRQDAVAALDAARRRKGELEGPIAELVADSTTSRTSLRSVDEQETALRAEARLAGPIAGFALVERAAVKRDEADALRVRIARNDVQLSELEPELALAELSAEQRTQLIGVFESTSAELARAADQAKALAAASRAEIARLRGEIESTLAAVNATRNGPIAELRSQAQQDLDRAASLAQRAAGPDAGRELQASARQTLAGARQALAQLHWQHAVALADERAVLERLRSLGDGVADRATVDARIAAIVAEQEAATTQAKEAANAALEAVGSLASDRADATALKENLSALLQAMEGRQTEIAGSGAGPTEEMPGFESPAALLEWLARGNLASPGHLRSIPHAYRASRAQNRPVLALIRMNCTDGVEVLAALYEKFGDAINEDPTMQMGLALPGADRYALGEVQENRATLGPTSPGVRAVPLVRAGGRWYVDLDGMLDGLPTAEVLRQQATMLQMSLPALEQMRPQLATLYAGFAKRIRAGEFASPTEAQMAMMGEVAQMMMGGAAGAAGPQGGVDAAMQKALEDAMKQFEGMSPEEIERLMREMEQQGGAAAPQK